MTNEKTAETVTPAPAVPETAIALPRGPMVATDAAQSVPMASAQDDGAPLLDRVDWVLLGLLVVLSFLVASTPAYNPDVWLHLGTGRLIAHGEYLPGGADPFSCATEATDAHAAVPWINHSWLYSLGLYLVYSTLGGAGTIVVKALFIAALAVVLIQIRSRGTHLLLVAVCLTLAVLTLSMRLFLQPVLVSYLFTAITLLVLHRAGVFDLEATEETPRSERALWLLPILCVLWVNLDSWFVLGPIVVALCWAGVALQRRRGRRTGASVSASRLGLVCGACVLACLVSPFHVRVFQLPPELSYLLVQAGDRLGVRLPDALVGGGRTLAILRQAVLSETNNQIVLPSTMSPFNAGYLYNPAYGYTIAGVCFYPLLALGFVSFIVTAFVAHKPGAPVLQPVRFLVWLFFALLAVLLYRLIPFFVVVAAPITALNLGDLVGWYTRPTEKGVPETPWVAPVRLARLLGVLLLLALLLLAWPGWLTGRHDLGSRNHVAWEMPPDLSMQAAAEHLAAIQRDLPAGEHVRVFTVGHLPLQPGLDLSCYLAWFAPGVKGFIDPRHHLFPNTIGPFVAARLALVDKANKHPASEWAGLFRAYRIDHVAVESFLATTACTGWWSHPGRWLQQFADRNAAVFAWSGTHAPWRADHVLADWNRQAFGPVPPSGRPAAKGLTKAPENRDLWARFLEPPLRLPQSAADLDVKVNYGEFSNKNAMQLAAQMIPVPTSRQIAPIYTVGAAPLRPGAFVGPWPILASVLSANYVKSLPRPLPLWVPPDSLPPAVPVLMMRRAWETVVTAPENERSFVCLANALRWTRRQEEFWLPVGQPPPTLRAALRRTQIMAALWTATDIGFTEPLLQYQIHRNLAELYAEQQALDLAADHFAVAEQAWDAVPEELHSREDWRKEKEKLTAIVKAVNEEVKRRKENFALNTRNLKPMEKVYQALLGTYQPLGKDQRQRPSPWGLAGMTLEMLNAMSFETLSEREQIEWLQCSIDLLFKVGQAHQASEILERAQNALDPFLRLRYGVFRAGTQGNYDELRKALAEREQMLAERVQEKSRLVVLASVALTGPAPTGEAFSRGGAMMTWLSQMHDWQVWVNELCNNRTLLGIAALEAGDTAEAQRHFAGALDGSAGRPFFEQAIALRYAKMLKRFQPR